MTKSDTIKELAGALAKFQAEVGNVAKDATNPFYKSKYATLENVISTVKPILAKHGLSFVQFPQERGLTTVLMHSSGEYMEAWSALIIKDETPQGQGSAITYLRRYALSAVLGIATEDDDDGNAATVAKPKEVGSYSPAPKNAPQGQNERSTATPKPPADIEKKRNLQKIRIAKLLDEIEKQPFMTPEEYKKASVNQTGMELEPHNFDKIEAALEAKKHGDE